MDKTTISARAGTGYGIHPWHHTILGTAWKILGAAWKILGAAWKFRGEYCAILATNFAILATNFAIFFFRYESLVYFCTPNAQGVIDEQTVVPVVDSHSIGHERSVPVGDAASPEGGRYDRRHLPFECSRQHDGGERLCGSP